MVTKNDQVNMVTFNFSDLSSAKYIVFIFQILCIGLFQNKQLLKHLQMEGDLYARLIHLKKGIGKIPSKLISTDFRVFHLQVQVSKK
jgi:hypothetical protein